MLFAMQGRRYLSLALLTLCLNHAGAITAFAQEVSDQSASEQSPEPETTSTENTAPAKDSVASPGVTLSDEARKAAAQIVASEPDDKLLQRAGARIGHVEIRVTNIFDPSNPKESGWLYRAANALHITSRDSTIRTQLLFKPGEPYARHVLDETARNLRARSYLNEATIVPVQYHPEDNTVDVLVVVHDVWTLNIGASYGRTGGANHSGFQLEEGNLLGFGKDLSLERSYEVDRSLWAIGYSDPNLFGSRWELDTTYATATDGGKRAFRIDHPFFSLDTHWSAAVEGSSERLTDRRYALGEEVDQYSVLHENYGASFGWSAGLRDSWVSRYSVGFRTDRFHYTANPDGLTLLPLPENQDYAYPWVQYDLLEDRYSVERNRDQIGRTEDVYYGRSFSIQLGASAPVFGADRTAWLMQLTGRDAWHLSARQSLFFALNVTGRYESSEWRGTLLSTTLRYDFRRNWKNLFTASLASDFGYNLDAATLLYLGGDTSDDNNATRVTEFNSSVGGLRGYPLHYRSGTRRNVLTVEQRYYTDWQILRLLTVGGAAFVDVGQISGGDPRLSTGGNVLSDVGVGLRFGNVRSSSGEVFHVDVAYALNAAPGVSKLQFQVVTKHSF